MKVLLKLTWIEIKLLVREPVTLLFSFAFPVLVLVLLGGIFGSDHMKQGAYQGVKMMDWYVPAFMGLVIASIGTISLPVHLSSYRERGVLRRFRASGVSEAALLGSQLLVSLGVALIGAVTIAVLGMVAYGASPASAPAGVALAYVVGVFCFSGIGMLLASLAPTARAAQSVGLLLWFIMLFVSGTSAPLDLLPELDGGHRQGSAALPPRDRPRGPLDRARRQLDAARHRGRHRSRGDAAQPAAVPLGVGRRRSRPGWRREGRASELFEHLGEPRLDLGLDLG